MASASILDLPPGLKEKVFSKSRCTHYYVFCPNIGKVSFRTEFKLKLRPFEILAIKDCITWVSKMELVGTLMAIDVLLVFTLSSHTIV